MMIRCSALVVLLITLLGISSQDGSAQGIRGHGDEEGQDPEVVAFEFRPQVGEGWRERSVSVVHLTWEAAGAESTMIDSVIREMSWEVAAETDSGYLVRWRYGPQRHFMNGRKVESLVEDYLEEKWFALLVGPSGEAVSEVDRATIADAAYPDTTTGTQPPALFNIMGFALRDWNSRVDVFFGQEWDQGESSFDVEEIGLLGYEPERLFSELWLESVSYPDDRPIARIEVRYFNVPADTLPVDDEGFLQYLDVLGIGDLTSSILTDVIAQGRGSWYMDANRMLIYYARSRIEGMVHRWSVDDGKSSVTSRFIIERTRRAVPLTP